MDWAALTKEHFHEDQDQRQGRRQQLGGLTMKIQTHLKAGGISWSG
jgi:hypothetical protein